MGSVESADMENNGARLASHIGLWILGLGIVVWLVYSATHTQTEFNRYAPGATVSDNHSARWPLTLDFNFSCVNQGLQDKWGQKKPEVNNVNPKNSK